MLYRILTENKNYSDVVKLLIDDGQDATLIKADGLWQGTAEHSLIIELLADDSTYARHLAWMIKKLNKQQAVLVQEIACDSYLV